jgi:1-deoxy-D-xylulose-5-phosphate reductoisomerase
VVGAAGLDATLAALRAGKRVALANKESLVMAGQLVADAARDGGGEVVPIDSEHSAVLQCVTAEGCQPSRVTLTASGGPFRTWERERLARATVADALQHPTWRMGSKITVDSATLVNKALEVIEAHFLFNLPYDAIDVVVHPQSIVHALVEFPDGSVLAQLGFPSMEVPILYALSHPGRLPDGEMRRFDPIAAGTLTFEPLRQECFPGFALGVAAGRAGGTMPASFNAANEVAVEAFLAGRIGFGDIAGVIESTLAQSTALPIDSVATVQRADSEARRVAREALA